MSEPDPSLEHDGPAPRNSLVVAFVSGVSPDKWARVWGERMTIPLDLFPRKLSLEDGLLDDADMALARIVDEMPDDLNSIELWNETPVVVAAKDHPISVVDSVSLAELEDENILDGEDDDTLDLVAAGIGLARMPQAVFRATGRRDVISRPVSDAEPTRISLVWKGTADDAMAEFIGIVRGRKANSSRGVADDDAAPKKKTAAAKAAAAAARAEAAKAAGQKKTPPRPARGFPRGKPGKGSKTGKPRGRR